MQRNRFVILAVPRSGSNMLSSLLNSHGDVLCHHELYNPNGIFYALPLRNTSFQLAESMVQRDQAPLEMLERIWEQDLGFTCVGFKMTLKQNPAVFDSLLNDASIKKIVLKRGNSVKTHISKLIAEQSKVWEDYGTYRVTNGEPPRGLQKVTVNLEEMRRDIAFNREYYAEIEESLTESNQSFLEVQYERLPDWNHQQAILNYLDLPHQRLTTESRKQNPTDISQMICNYSELVQECDETLLAQLRNLSD